MFGKPAPLEARLPPGLAAIVRRCLENDARHRFANASELRRALLPLSDTRPIVCPLAATQAIEAVVLPSFAPAAPAGAKRRSPKRRLYPALAATVLGLACFTGWTPRSRTPLPRPR